MGNEKLFFNWDSLDGHGPISQERMSRLKGLVYYSAYQFLNQPYAHLGPETLADSKTLISFFDGIDMGYHDILDNGIETIGLNSFLVDSDAELLITSFHEFSHSYDFRKKLILQDDKKSSRRIIESEIRAYEKELEFMKTMPAKLWPVEGLQKDSEMYVLQELDKYKQLLASAQS